MNYSILIVSSVIFPIQWIGWLIANHLKTEKFYDFTGCLTYVISILTCFKLHGVDHPRQLIQSSVILIWALRLGLYLLYRALSRGDRRFNVIKHSPLRFFIVWNIQGVWALNVLFPSVLCLSNPNQSPLGIRDFLGWGIWMVGFFIEAAADLEKTLFQRDLANKGKFIKSGLWSISRHPNYFGEILLWFGLYLSASSTFSGLEYFSGVTVILTYLLINYVSKVNLLEEYGMKKWGKDQDYQEYLKATPVLVPFLK